MRPTAFSRSGTSSPFGKLGARIETFKVEQIVKDKFAERAAQAGKPAVEFLREVMRIVAFGPEHIERMHSEEVRKVVRMLGKKV